MDQFFIWRAGNEINPCLIFLFLFCFCFLFLGYLVETLVANAEHQGNDDPLEVLHHEALLETRDTLHDKTSQAQVGAGVRSYVIGKKKSWKIVSIQKRFRRFFRDPTVIF